MEISRPRRSLYGGRDADERRAERRARLIDAATEIWAEHGWAAVTMRGVCVRAALIDRYFYESFTDRDELLVEIWDQFRDQTIVLVSNAFLASFRERGSLADVLRAVITAFVNTIVADSRLVRIGFGVHAGSASLEERRRAAVRQIADVFVDAARPFFKNGVDEQAFRVSCLMGIGGFYELVAAWHAGIIGGNHDTLIEHAVRVGAHLAHEYVPVDPFATRR